MCVCVLCVSVLLISFSTASPGVTFLRINQAAGFPLCLLDTFHWVPGGRPFRGIEKL